MSDAVWPISQVKPSQADPLDLACLGQVEGGFGLAGTYDEHDSKGPFDLSEVEVPVFAVTIVS